MRCFPFRPLLAVASGCCQGFFFFFFFFEEPSLGHTSHTRCGWCAPNFVVFLGDVQVLLFKLCQNKSYGILRSSTEGGGGGGTSPKIIDSPCIIFLLSSFFTQSRLIISQMTGQPAEIFNFLLIPLMAALVASFALPRYEMPILYAYFAAVLFAHLHYAISIVEELSEHFNIYVFSLAKK